MISIKEYTKHTIIIKKSEFVCHLIPCSDIDKAKELIELYSDKEANHNCIAYIIGQHERANDDGEPSQTAGMPMLNVLKMQGLTNIIAIVTRYFGGIKLGAGGLTRAYTQSIAETLKEATIVEKELVDLYEISVDYSYTRKIEHLMKQLNIKCIQQEYNEKVSYQCYLKDSHFLDQVQELTSNQFSYQIISSDYIEKEN
ncbi:MAG: YigZ family protein [Coprobacillus sp.]